MKILACRPAISALAQLACVVSACMGCSASGSGAEARTTNTQPAGASAGTSSGAQPVLSTGGSAPVLVPLMDVPDVPCEAVLSLTLRDFTPSHPDFESYQGLN